MEIALRESMFENNTYSVSYGTDKQAVFTIIDEEFKGNNRLGRINRMTCLVRTFSPDGSVSSGVMGSLVVGLGDQLVGVRSENTELRGKLLTHDVMDQCVVELYE
jgi:hypothetical protein